MARFCASRRIISQHLQDTHTSAPKTKELKDNRRRLLYLSRAAAAAVATVDVTSSPSSVRCMLGVTRLTLSISVAPSVVDTGPLFCVRLRVQSTHQCTEHTVGSLCSDRMFNVRPTADEYAANFVYVQRTNANRSTET